MAGILDILRRLLNTLTSERQANRPQPSRTMGGARAPPPLPPHEAALRAKQAARGAVTRKSGKPARRWHVQGYERLERQVTLRLGKFPWTRSEARDALREKGFDARHVEAYLDSPAARKLLE